MARAAVFFAAALTLAATVIGNPFALDAVIIGQPAGQQTGPRVAASNDQFLAAWVDTRDGMGRVWGTRLDLDASVLDPLGFPLSFDNGAVPAVASDGTGFLVVFRRDQSTPAREEIWAVRVDPAGALGAPIPVCLDAGMHPAAPEVVFDGVQYQVAFVARGFSAVGNLMVASVDVGAGSVGGCGAPVIPPATLGNPRLAASPLGPLLQWTGALPDGGPGLLAKIGAASPVPLYEGQVDELGGVYSGASGALWAWTITDAGTRTLLGRQLLFDGGWLDAAPRVLALRNYFHTVSGSAVDGGFTLYWTDWPQQQAVRSLFVDVNTMPAGAVATVAATGYVNTVDVATTSSRAAVTFAFDELSNLPPRVRVLSASAHGAPLEPLAGHALATAGNAQFLPAVATSRSEWLVAWEDTRNHNPSVWAVPVAFDGALLGAPFLVSGTLVGQRPSVASDGTDFLVAFDDGLTVQTVRVGRSGPLGSARALSPNGTRARAAFDGQQYRVVWLRPASTWTLQGQRLGVDDAGVTVVALDQVTLPTAFEVATVEGVTIAVWPQGAPSELRGAVVSFDGGVADGGIQLVNVGSGSLLEPQLLALHDRWLLTWARPRNSASRSEGRAGAAFVYPDAGVELLALPELPDAGVGAVLPLKDPVRLIYAAGATGGLPSFDLTLTELGVADSGQVIAASADSELPGAAAPSPDGGAWLFVERVFDSTVQTSRLRARLLCEGSCPVVVTPDAGVQPDAGSSTDAGSSGDAGVATDAGESLTDGGNSAEPRMTAVGCGCSSAEGVVALVAVLLLIRQRRRTASNAA